MSEKRRNLCECANPGCRHTGPEEDFCWDQGKSWEGFCWDCCSLLPEDDAEAEAEAASWLNRVKGVL